MFYSQLIEWVRTTEGFWLTLWRLDENTRWSAEVISDDTQLYLCGDVFLCRANERGELTGFERVDADKIPDGIKASLPTELPKLPLARKPLTDPRITFTVG